MRFHLRRPSDAGDGDDPATKSSFRAMPPTKVRFASDRRSVRQSTTPRHSLHFAPTVARMHAETALCCWRSRRRRARPRDDHDEELAHHDRLPLVVRCCPWTAELPGNLATHSGHPRRRTGGRGTPVRMTYDRQSFICASLRRADNEQAARRR